MTSPLADLEGRFPSVTSHLSREELEAFAGALTPLDLPAEAALIREGEASDRLYLLHEGSLVVTIRSANGEEEVGRLGPGAIVGEVSVLDPGPASATVTAEGAARLHSLSAAALDAFAASEPNVAVAILHALCETTADRIARTNDRCDEVLRRIDPQKSLVDGLPKGGFLEYFKLLFGHAGL